MDAGSALRIGARNGPREARDARFRELSAGRVGALCIGARNGNPAGRVGALCIGARNAGRVGASGFSLNLGRRGRGFL